MKKILKGNFDEPQKRVQELLNRLDMMEEIYTRYRSEITRDEAVKYTIAQVKETFELEIEDDGKKGRYSKG